MARSARVWDKIAPNYLDEIISPFHHSIYNPLNSFLKRIRGKRKLIVADLGCGAGHLLPRLAKSFARVYAVDYSANMLENAKDFTANLPPKQQSKISFHKRDLSNLHSDRNKFDTAIASNSIITVNPVELKKIFREIFNSIRPGGHFMGVFPALEAIQEEFRYCYNNELKKFGSDDLARASVRKKLKTNKVNFKLGHYNTGDMVQKYFTQYELVSYLEAVGFCKIIFDRVIYNQNYSYNYGDENTQDHPPMWDWAIYCEKK